jgi:hypothetical protein
MPPHESIVIIASTIKTQNRLRDFSALVVSYKGIHHDGLEIMFWTFPLDDRLVAVAAGTVAVVNSEPYPPKVWFGT